MPSGSRPGTGRLESGIPDGRLQGTLGYTRMCTQGTNLGTLGTPPAILAGGVLLVTYTAGAGAGRAGAWAQDCSSGLAER